ncbi:hypothetical protein PIB30_096472, partial [Stylosanthes scabra]|nr:hypothetical protein [Stylosanthes scabra]
PTLYVSSPMYIVGNSNFHEDFRQKPHVIRGSYTYNVEANFKSITLSNSNSNPRPFENQFHLLIKGIIGRIKRRLIED